MKRLLITGGSGRLGREFVKLLPESLHPTHKELEIVDRKNVFVYIKEHRPSILIHCAALTSIRQCEQDKELAWKTNVEGTENIVDACIEWNPQCFFVYLSTACVFHGDRGDYVETDIPYPKNFYSLTKLLGETMVRRSRLDKWLIVRTNFVARERWPYPRAFTDRYGTYLFADQVALGIKLLIEREMSGIVHIHGEDKISMYELAKITTPDIQPITLDDYTGPPLTIDMSLRSCRISAFKLCEKSSYAQ